MRQRLRSSIPAVLFFAVCLLFSSCQTRMLEAEAPASGPYKVYPCTEIVFVASPDVSPAMMASKVETVNLYGQCDTTLQGTGTIASQDESVTYFFPVFIRSEDVPSMQVSASCPEAEPGEAVYTNAAIEGSVATASVILPTSGTWTVDVSLTAKKRKPLNMSFSFEVTANGPAGDTAESLMDSLTLYQSLLRGWEYVERLGIYKTLHEYAVSTGFQNTILPNIQVNPESEELQAALEISLEEIENSLRNGENLYDTPDKIRNNTPLARLLAWKGISPPTEDEINDMYETGDFWQIASWTPET